MSDLSSDLISRAGEHSNVGSLTLVHHQHHESLADYAKHMVATPDVDSSSTESCTDKLAREARVLTYGVGGAFGDVAQNPISKLPEVASAGAFGVGVKVLQKAGTGGKVVVGAVGAGMAIKMGYDELTGNRWSEFGGAMSSAWDSSSNFQSSVEATKHSVGSLAVDFSVGTIAYKAVGLSEPMVSRSSSLTKNDLSLSYFEPSRLTKATEFSRLGERSSSILGEPALPLRSIAKVPTYREFALLGERTTLTTVGDAALKESAIRRELAIPRPVEKPLAKSVESVLPLPASNLTDSLKANLLSGKVEEFGYLSAIREVASVEMDAGFRPGRASYGAIADTLEVMSQQAGPEFAPKYRDVARLVRQHSQRFPKD
jgi:hypothetical protein